LADSGHLCSFATHDWELINRIDQHLGGKGTDSDPWEFETLLGLGFDRLQAMAERGHPTGSTSSSARNGGSTSATASPKTPSACSRASSTRPHDHHLIRAHVMTPEQ
jgi:hypothetical protein